MSATPSHFKEHEPLERIRRHAGLLQVKLAGVAGMLRERGAWMTRDVESDLEGLVQALDGFRRDLEEQEAETGGVVSREAQLALFDVSKAITGSLDLQTVLNKVMDAVVELTHAERGYLVLLNETGEFGVQVARNLDQDTLRSMEFAFSSTVIAEVIKSDRSVLTNNAQTDERFSLQRSVTMFRLTSIMAAPLRIRGKVIGVLYVDNRAFAGQFSQQGLELLEAFAGQAAIAIHNAQLFGQTDEALKQRIAELEALYKELAVARERAEKGLVAVEREMKIGRLIQAEFLPRDMPSLPGWQVAARFLPARHLSGDFYDVFPLPGGAVTITIADVCDKGVGAALFMSLVRGLLRAHASRHRDAATVMSAITQTNDYLADNHGRTAMFTTVFFGVLDPVNGTLEYVNCGHDAPILLRASGEEERLESTGPALGAMRDVEFEPAVVKLELGDMLVAFTDGVTDALDPSERAFGEERFLPFIRKKLSSVTAMLGEIEAALRAHIGTAPQFDDITLLALRRNPGRDESGSTMSRTEPPPAPARVAGGLASRRRPR
ncbi:PP2C family protein-serine/threonine phosphatase [Polyangium aurulentum]|uniref:PP2C family protein-serine/threonine phosphatase n=1 Tax=Polyangium aurulentum TaxID=2567896 RepID=UPI001469C217|nr:GAF domain-containing SpoIIE family protein phosphatase [Polyangium aurulentum]UQA60864.1 SpoIIE family protein phosphatase [Polyangium aurulentum]